MVLQEITKIFERRRSELHSLLSDRKDEIGPELQHQMYGAMNEIDIFLKTMEYYREKEIDHEIQNAVLVGPMIREGMMTRLVNTLNKKMTDIKLARKNKRGGSYG